MKRQRIEINDINLLDHLRIFIKNREKNFGISSKLGVDAEGTERLYNSYIKPMLEKERLKKGTSRRKKMSPVEMEEYAGNLFALSMYGKNNEVSDWIYEPEIDNKTPDFFINDESEIIEFYSPLLEELLPNLESLTKNVQDKTDAYKSFQLKIIVHVFTEQFINVVSSALKKVTLANKSHALFLYHGQNEIPV